MGSALEQEEEYHSTIEGCPETIEVAKTYLNEGELLNYTILEGHLLVFQGLSKTKKLRFDLHRWPSYSRGLTRFDTDMP